MLGKTRNPRTLRISTPLKRSAVQGTRSRRTLRRHARYRFRAGTVPPLPVRLLCIRLIAMTPAECGHVVLQRPIVVVPPRRRGEWKVAHAPSAASTPGAAPGAARTDLLLDASGRPDVPQPPEFWSGSPSRVRVLRIEVTRNGCIVLLSFLGPLLEGPGTWGERLTDSRVQPSICKWRTGVRRGR